MGIEAEWFDSERLGHKCLVNAQAFLKRIRLGLRFTKLGKRRLNSSFAPVRIKLRDHFRNPSQNEHESSFLITEHKIRI